MRNIFLILLCTGFAHAAFAAMPDAPRCRALPSLYRASAPAVPATTRVAVLPGAAQRLAAEEAIAAFIAHRQWDDAHAAIRALPALPAGIARIDPDMWALTLAAAQQDTAKIAHESVRILRNAGEGTDTAPVFALLKATGNDAALFASPTARAEFAKTLAARGANAAAYELTQPVAGALAGAAWDRVLADFAFGVRQYPESYDRFTRLIPAAQAAGGAENLALLNKAASAAARAGRIDDALQLQTWLAEHMTGAERSTAWRKRAFLFRDAGQFSEAARAYSDWWQRATSHEERRDAAWGELMSHWRARNFPHARDALSRLSSFANTGLWHARVEYWTARVAEASGEKARARQAWRELAHNGSHGWYQRLARAQLKGRSHMRKLFHAATVRRAHTTRPLAGDPNIDDTLARGEWHLGLRALDAYERIPTQLQSHHDWLIDHLGPYWGLDPMLIRAIITQESNGNPSVVSPAGAVGVMQIMPATGRRVASEFCDFSYQGARDLFLPSVNLQLGMAYVHMLMQRYNGSLPHVLAAYNAGEAAVDRWMSAHRGAEVDEFVEEIPYSETQNYVRKILLNYGT